MWGSQEKKLGQKVNVKFFRVDPYTLGNRIPRAFQNLSDLHVQCHREKFYIGFLSQIFFGSHYTCGGVSKKFRAKSQWKIFQGRPRRKKSKNVKKILFSNSPVLRNWSHFWEVWQFSTHPRCVRVCGKLPNLPNMASVSQNRGVRKYLRCSCLTQGRLCILEWSNWPEILRWRSPCRELYTVLLYRC